MSGCHLISSLRSSCKTHQPGHLPAEEEKPDPRPDRPTPSPRSPPPPPGLPFPRGPGAKVRRGRYGRSVWAQVRLCVVRQGRLELNAVRLSPVIQHTARGEGAREGALSPPSSPTPPPQRLPSNIFFLEKFEPP